MRKWRRRFQWEKLFPWKKGFPWRIAGRILDRRAIMIYFAAWLLFFAVTPGHKGAMAILGGFSPQESRGMDILGIIRWNLCVLPPVAVSILFMDVEMGVLRVYTMVRSGSMKKWFLARLLGIAAANLVYLLLFVGIAEIGMGSGDYKRNGFGLFLAVFFLHSFLMSVFSVALCGKNRRVHKAVVFYLLVEGIMVVIGDNFPRTAACLPPYWGMIQQVGGSSTGYLFGIIILSAVIIVVSAVFIKKGLRA
jgi:hypothetical protein